MLSPYVRVLSPTVIMSRNEDGCCMICQFDAPDEKGVCGEMIRYSYKLAGEGKWNRVWNREYCQG
jgi:hypothetical protein